MTFTNNIDGLRVTLWLEKLMEATGTRSPTELARQLDPKSFWIDEDQGAKQSKWYCYQRMSQVPSQALSDLVRSKVPKAYSELHHPMWRLLRNSDVSDRTVRRLRRAMREEWQYSYAGIARLKDSELKISISLVDLLRLDRLTYLDALMVFTIARREAVALSNQKRTAHLSNVLWALPTLYPDDPLWFQDDLSTLGVVLAVIDEALQLKSIVAKSQQGEVITRERQLLGQHLAAEERTRAKPRSLSSPVATRRFYARWPDRFAFCALLTQ